MQFSLYCRIKELVNGDGPLQFKFFGDPTNLNSMKLNDLHPRSWLVRNKTKVLNRVHVSVNEASTVLNIFGAH